MRMDTLVIGGDVLFDLILFTPKNNINGDDRS